MKKPRQVSKPQSEPAVEPVAKDSLPGIAPLDLPPDFDESDRGECQVLGEGAVPPGDKAKKVAGSRGLPKTRRGIV